MLNCCMRLSGGFFLYFGAWPNHSPLMMLTSICDVLILLLLHFLHWVVCWLTWIFLVRMVSTHHQLLHLIFLTNFVSFHFFLSLYKISYTCLSCIFRVFFVSLNYLLLKVLGIEIMLAFNIKFLTYKRMFEISHILDGW